MSDRTPSQERIIVVYDGLCGLCHGWVRFLLRRDKAKAFCYASLQGRRARQSLARHGRSPEPADSLYVVVSESHTGERLFSKSRAVLYTLTRLGGWWRALALLYIVPRALADIVYDAIARNRYRFSRRYEVCPPPPREARERFLVD